MKMFTLLRLQQLFAVSLIVATFFATLPREASATFIGEPGISVLNTSGTGAGPSRTVGWQFQANQDFQITALGVADINGSGVGAGANDGFFDPHEVIVWDTAGNQLASTVVKAGTGSDIGPGTYNASPASSAAFRYETLENPLSVSSGTTYVITAFFPFNFSNADPYNNAASSSASFSSLITYGGTRFVDGATHTFPTQRFGFPPITGPNFLATPVPEPSTAVLLLGFGVSALCSRRRLS